MSDTIVLSDKLQSTLSQCIEACENCATSCLSEDNVGKMANCIQLDRDCADICALTLRFIARGSDYKRSMVQQCINICKACEAECRKHDHEHCQQCAEACHACHKACEEYLN